MPHSQPEISILRSFHVCRHCTDTFWMISVSFHPWRRISKNFRNF